MISSNEYFQYALRHDLLSRLKFYYATMTIPLQNENEYFKIEKDKYFVLMNGEYQEVQGKTTKNPLLHSKDEITLFNADMANVKESVDTTIGRAITNYIMLARNFEDKIEYVNEYVDGSKIEGKVCEALKKDIITIDQYINFVNSCGMLQGLSRIVSVSATYKAMTPPPGLIKYKKELKEAFDKEFGKNWVKDSVRVIEFGNKLKEKDAEYLKGDATDGKLVSGKIKDNARSKMYLTFGTDAGFDSVGADPKLVFNSLLEGYPEDKEELATVYNSSRAGSFSRGNETKDGGVLAKTALRSTANVTIEPGDCGTKRTKPFFVLKDNAAALTGRYMVEGNKLVKIEDGTKLIGKTIQLRSMLYCEYKHPMFCSVCAGENLANYRKGATIEATSMSNTILTLSLKKMHNNTKKIHKTDLLDMIK